MTVVEIRIAHTFQFIFMMWSRDPIQFAEISLQRSVGARPSYSASQTKGIAIRLLLSFGFDVFGDSPVTLRATIGEAMNLVFVRYADEVFVPGHRRINLGDQHGWYDRLSHLGR